MIVVDTNILSELQKTKPNPNVQNWLDKQDFSSFYLCSIVLAELSAGAELFFKRTGSRKHLLALDTILIQVGERNFLNFDHSAAKAFGLLHAEQISIGKSKPIVDLMIASICIVNGATLATRNTKDFEGLDLKLVNPFKASE